MSETQEGEPENPRFDTADNGLRVSTSQLVDEMFVEEYFALHQQPAPALITNEDIEEVYKHARGSLSLQGVITEKPTEAELAPDNVIPLFSGNTDECSSHQSTPDEK